MNQIIKYGGIQTNPLYNCSAHSPEEWSRLNGVRHPYIGAFDIFYGITIDILYIPIIAFMMRPENFKMSCFKIMSFLGIIDMLAITVNSTINGYLAIKGAVFCTYPQFNYIVGMLVLGWWCCSCILALLLVVNRLLDLTKPGVVKFLFEGHRTCFVLLIPILYGVYFSVFTNPVGFNSKYVTWLFDPLIFEGKSNEYVNISHSVNNFLVVAITAILYAVLYCTLGEKLKTSGFNNSQRLSLQILVQSSMICSINMAASVVFVLMNLMPFPIWVFISCQKAWQMIHGAPVIIYLTLNKTIRKGALKMLGFETEQRVGNTSMIN